MYNTQIKMSFHEQYSSFNRLYDDFIVKLIEFFPTVHKIKFYRELFHQFKKADYRIVARLFLSSVGEHSTYIFNKDESYFLSGVEVTKTRERAIIEQTIIQEWMNMSEIQKETVWFYLQRMLIVVMDIEDDDDCTNETNGSIEQQACNTLRESFIKDGVLMFNENFN